VKIIEDKLSKDLDPDTGKERHIVIYYFEENGERKMYVVPVKNKQGGVHYLVQKFSEFKTGDELILEGKKRGVKNYIAVIKVADGQEVEMEDEEAEQSEVVYPPLDEEEESEEKTKDEENPLMKM